MHSLFDFLYRRGIAFLLIGGRGLERHGHVRSTLDIDLLVRENDLESLGGCLRDFGYAKTAETPIFSRWRSKDPAMLDVDLLHVDESTFAKLDADAVSSGQGSLAVRVPSVGGMIALKLHAMRNQPDRRVRDTQDIQALLRLNPEALELEGLRRLCERYGPPGIFESIRGDAR